MKVAPYPNFPNKAHQRAFLDGVAAAVAGRERFAPYSADNASSRHFRRAWLAGFDGATDRVAAVLADNPGIGTLMRDGARVYYVSTPAYLEAADPDDLVGGTA